MTAPQYAQPQFVPGGYPAPPAYGPPPQQYQQPQYAPPPMPGYPPMQMAPAPQLVQGSLDDFYNQPSTAGGGPALKFPNAQFGTRYAGFVSRAITSADVRQQTTPQGQPQFFKDGRPKFDMRVPLTVQPSAQFPEGAASLYVKGAMRDELVRAMAEAGAPAGPPEQGALIDITYIADRPIQGMSPQKQFRITYTRPGGARPVEQHAPVQAPVAQPQFQQPVQPQYAPPATVTYAQTAPMAQPQFQQPAPVQQAAAPSDLSDEQQALLARLTNQPQS